MRTLCFPHWGLDSITDWGTKILQASRCNQKKKIIKGIHDFNHENHSSFFFLSYSVPFPNGYPFYQFFVKSSRTILHITSKCFFPFLIQMLAYHTHLSKLFRFFIFQLKSLNKRCWSMLHTEVSSSWKKEKKWKSLSCVWSFATPWTVQSMKFSRAEYWSG